MRSALAWILTALGGAPSVGLVDDSMPGLAIAVLLIATLLGALAAWRGAALLRGARARSRMLRARRGEHAARGLLISLGFEVMDAQAPGSVVLQVDGERSVHAVRADYLVRRGGRTFVAEVKTGARAPSLDHAPTRRQLLEYRSAFAIDGILLVDPEARRVREVSFPDARGPRWPVFAWGLALGIAISALAALVAMQPLTSP